MADTANMPLITSPQVPFVLQSPAQVRPLDPQTDCALFSLPPELRNLIYNLVLCGNTIHVNSVWDLDEEDEIPAKHLRVCVCGGSDDHISATLRKETSDDHEFETYGKRHEKCGLTDECPTNYDISLLRTCQQIYTETRHIPILAANTFSFRYRMDLNTFICNVKPEKRHLIKAITLGDIIDAQYACYDADLPGLRHVNIFRTVPIRHPAFAWNSTRELIVGKQLDSVSQKLSSATICVHYGLNRCGVFDGYKARPYHITHDALVKLRRKIEQQVLGSGSSQEIYEEILTTGPRSRLFLLQPITSGGLQRSNY